MSAPLFCHKDVDFVIFMQFLVILPRTTLISQIVIQNLVICIKCIESMLMPSNCIYENTNLTYFGNEKVLK